MSCFVTLDSLSAATPEGRPLFTDLTLALGRERTGLVGRNGSGKSSLLRIVAGEAMPTGGSVTRAGSVGVLRQSWPEDWRIDEVLGVRAGLERLARVLAGSGGEADFAEADWTLEERVAAALAQSELAEVALDRIVATLSGGERTRVGIARLRLDAPDLLLLDEPTNNLDAEGRAAVAALLDDWKGGVLVASHDRALLEGMDRIVELTPLGARVFGGGWSAFAEAREAERERAVAEVERAGGALRSAEAGAQQARERQARRDRAGRAYAASGSAPKILLGRQKERAENSAGRGAEVGERVVGAAEARLAAARDAVEVVTPLVIELASCGLSSSRRLLAFEDAMLDRGGRRFGPWRFEIIGPERVAVSGSNGAGKTSLLLMALGELLPTSGRVWRAEGRVAMLDQHVGLLAEGASVLENFRRLHPRATEREAHAACARFAFRNRDALNLVGDLSGGERMRAGLACVLGGETMPQLLLLDEPTNHLDMESVEVLEAALAGYDGALLVVSHDRAFLHAIGVGREIEIPRPVSGATRTE